jgi:hypothetical protein
MNASPSNIPGFRQTPAWLLPFLLISAVTCSCLLSSSLHALLFASACTAAILLSLIFYFRPMVAVYLLIVAFPLQSIILYLRIELDAQIQIYLFELLAAIMLPVLVAQVLAKRVDRPGAFTGPMSFWFCWLLFFSALFIVYSPFTLLWTRNPYTYKMVVGLWRQNCNFVFCAFLVVHVNEYRRFRNVLLTWCFVAVFLSIMAICASNFRFYSIYHLINAPHLASDFETTFINKGGFYDPRALGIAPGFGLSSKHGLGLFLCTGIVFCLFLVKEYRSFIAKITFLILLLLYVTILSMTLAKASVLGLFLCTVFMSIVISPWRKYLPVFILGFILMFSLGNVIAPHLRPSYQNVSTAFLMRQLPKDSAHEQGTYAHRLKIMGHSVTQIGESSGLGEGPDIMEIIPPEYIHAHNIFLSFATDYGFIGVIFVVSALVLVGKFAYAGIIEKPHLEDSSWLLRCTLFTAFLIALAESLVDVFIWYPQIWILGALFLAANKIDEGDYDDFQAFESVERQLSFSPFRPARLGQGTDGL